MSEARLQFIKSATQIAGVVVTLSGIAFSALTGGSLIGAGISLTGVLITCAGYWTDHKLRQHQAAEKAADEARVTEIERELSKVKNGDYFRNA